ncbi:MAG TPA: XdhC family protein [Ferruginibacter sp.]|nr:XdhC family protein [Ferruginibacter sp.]
MALWEFIKNKLSSGQQLVLLYVLESEGSSPGRKGFKMAVAGDETFSGTIGGGIMEHKLVEKAKNMLKQNEKDVLLMRQHHDKEHMKDQSGMICSGSQLNAFIPLSSPDISTIESIIDAKQNTIHLSKKGITITDLPATGLQYKTGNEWIYTEAVKQQPIIHIIGGGHVGLALSELMNFLGFYIKLYDDRPGLNTIDANIFAHEKYMVNYDDIGKYFEQVEDDYVVIMTIGYRTDKAVLKQLLGRSFFYLGLLGSDHKIKILLAELEQEGFSGDVLKNIHTPIGLNIFSKTTKEIAVSIAAEIIREKNKDLPTGRAAGDHT